MKFLLIVPFLENARVKQIVHYLASLTFIGLLSIFLSHGLHLLTS